jgi:hypothetical protein
MKVRVWGPNLRDQSKGSFHVHSADCRDNRNYGPRGRLGGEGTTGPEDYDSVQQLVEDYYSNQIAENPGDTWEDGYVQDFHFAPCVELPYERPASA